MGRNTNVLKGRLKSISTLKQYTVSNCFQEVQQLIETDDNENFLSYLNSYKIGINDLGQFGGPSLLMLVTENGNFSLFKELIRKGAELNYQDSNGSCSLLIAVKEELIDFITEILDAGADIEIKDSKGLTALHYASYIGNLEITKLLLKKNANPNVYDNNHICPLTWSSGRGFLDITIILLAHAAKVDSADKYGTTPLIWAARKKNHLEIVQKLIKANANVDATGMFGWTALLVSVVSNHEKIVECILEAKPNVNACDAQGMTALMIASKGSKGNINIVNMLIHSNSYVNLQDKNGDTSLIHASKAGHLQIVEALIKAHAAVDHQGDERKTALYCAVEKNHIDVIKALLKANPNLELFTKDGDTCLMKAVRNRKLPIVKLLVDKKAKISASDKHGDTALHIASRAQSKAILEFILRNPKNSQLLYKPNKNGETPFTLDNSHHKSILPTLFGAAPSSRRVLEKETQLGYDLYSSAIANLLSEPSLKTPICVGLFAKWGSGKSFLVGKLKEDLLAFTKDWMIEYSFKFTWTLILLVTMISSLVGAITLVLTLGELYYGFIGTVATFFGIYAVLGIIYFGSLKYSWSISYSIKSKLEKLKLVLQICFGNPPILDNEQISSRPVNFLFTETPIKISTDSNVCQLISEIHKSLWRSIENKYGYLSIKLFKVFQPKAVVSSTWKWRRICGTIPTILLFVIMFFTVLFGISFLLSKNQLSKVFYNYLIFSYIAVGTLSIAGAWILGNIKTPFKILRELTFSPKYTSREELKKEVELMQLCIHSLDAFTNEKQNRLVIILDALESIYESDRLMSFLEAININFLSARSHQFTNIPFIILLTLDPHHHITAKSEEYLKTIVHLPFYLQNSQLRRVKVAQQTTVKTTNEIKSSTTSLVDAITQAPIVYSDSYKFGSTGSTFQKKKSKKSNNLLKSSDSIISLCGPSSSNEVPIKVLLTDDYFSDVNPKSIRKIMNIVYIQGRLLKAFNLDFSWHKLTTWVNITEQWPVRASSLIVLYEMYENKYPDDSISLKTLYDKVCFVLGQSKQVISNMKDSDEKKLNAFLSLPHNFLTLADMKIFSPFAINLDPLLKKLVQEVFSETPLFNLYLNRPLASNLHNQIVNKNSSITNSITNNKPKFSDFDVEGIISLLKKIEKFDLTMIDKYSETLRHHNINGKVLSCCSDRDLDDLKKVLDFSFGDWLLFKKIVLENKESSDLNLIDSSLTNSLPISILKNSTFNSEYLKKISTCSMPLFNDQSYFESQSQNFLALPNKNLNLEKQATMEETTLQSGIIEDDEENESSYQFVDSCDLKTDSNEVDILFIKNSSTKVSPSVSFIEEATSDNTVNLSQSIEEDVENDLTPLAYNSKPKNSISSNSSSYRHKLERQKQFDFKEAI